MAQHPSLVAAILTRWMAGQTLTDAERMIVADISEQVAAQQLARLILPSQSHSVGQR